MLMEEVTFQLFLEYCEGFGCRMEFGRSFLSVGFRFSNRSPYGSVEDIRQHTPHDDILDQWRTGHLEHREFPGGPLYNVGPALCVI